MTELELACEEIYMTIYDDIEHYCQDNYKDITEDKFLDEIIEETYNGTVTFTNTNSYNQCVLCVKNIFEIVKIVSKISREEYDITFNVETIEKTIDLYAYLCAKEIAYKMIELYNFGEESEEESEEEEKEELAPQQ